MRLNFNINLLKNKIEFLVFIYYNLVIHEKKSQANSPPFQQIFNNNNNVNIVTKRHKQITRYSNHLKNITIIIVHVYDLHVVFITTW